MLKVFQKAVIFIICMGYAAYAAEVRSPYQIVAEAPAAHWRALDADNTLYIDLPSGRVVIELTPDFAPENVANIKALVRDGFYTGLSVYRVVDGFVAQGGDQSGAKRLINGKRGVVAEFTRKNFSGPYTPVAGPDGYAEETGFVKSHPVGRDPETGEAWPLHCAGAVTISRGENPNSGGTDFAISLGHAPRYLDRNITVVGHVMYGMEHLQKLQRGAGPMGMVENPEQNEIKAAYIAADLAPNARTSLEVLDSDAASFKELIQSRSNRPEAWFVKRHAYVDVCGVPVPVRAIP